MLDAEKVLKPCIHCGAPWHIKSVDPKHSPTCPIITNIYSVCQNDMQPFGLICEWCGFIFKVGDLYKIKLIEDRDDAYSVYCLSCSNMEIRLS